MSRKANHITIYLVQNELGHTKYVGITHKPLSSRISDHKYEVRRGSQYLIHKAMRKHELTFVEFLSLKDWKTACEIERELISKFKTHVSQGGYNLTIGGEGSPGRIVSNETKRRISKAKKGKSKGFTRKHTEESKRKMSESLTGRTIPVLQVKIIDNNGVVYSSITEASKTLGVKRTTIGESLRLNRTLRNGMKFSYYSGGVPSQSH